MGHILGLIILIIIFCVILISTESFGGAIQYPQFQELLDNRYKGEKSEHAILENYFGELFCEIFKQPKNFQLALDIDRICIVSKPNSQVALNSRAKLLVQIFNWKFNKKWQVIGISNMLAKYRNYDHFDVDTIYTWNDALISSPSIYYFDYENLSSKAVDLFDTLSMRDLDAIIILDELTFFYLKYSDNLGRFQDDDELVQKKELYKLDYEEMRKRFLLYVQNQDALWFDKYIDLILRVSYYGEKIIEIEKILESNHNLSDYAIGEYLIEYLYSEMGFTTIKENNSDQEDEYKHQDSENVSKQIKKLTKKDDFDKSFGATVENLDESEQSFDSY